MNRESFDKGIENKHQTEVTKLKNTITELKIYLEGFNSGLEWSRRKIRDLGDKEVELTQTEKQKTKKVKTA